MRILIVPILCLSFVTAGCGEESGSRGSRGPASAVESLFQQVARQQNVPERMLLAAAYLESGIDASRATSLYINPNDEAVGTKGVRVGETAFGIPASRLGLADEVPHDLAAQVTAYGQTLRAEMLRSNMDLPAYPVTAEDKFRWIWLMAQVHRDGQIQRRNVQILFSRELMDVLNNGFVWQDRESSTILRFQPESPAIRFEDLAPDQQKSLRIISNIGETFNAQYLPLTSIPPSSEHKNVPKRVVVVHCPFSLSSCLELQQHDGDDARLGAHYIIPSRFVEGVGAEKLRDRIIQIARHEQLVQLTLSTGDHQFVHDAIVVMLSGSSGRIVEGIRKPANPMWASEQQLQALAQLVGELCTEFQATLPIDRQKCLRRGGDQGVQFQRQEASEVFRWGDIADFDETIFDAYLENPAGLPGGDAAFTLPEKVAYNAGQDVPISLSFNTSVRSVELEQLVRCGDGRLVWMPSSIDQVRGVSTLTVRKKIWSSGPNGNGRHFFRARVLTGSDELAGWDTVNIDLRSYEDTPDYSPKACASNQI